MKVAYLRWGELLGGDEGWSFTEGDMLKNSVSLRVFSVVLCVTSLLIRPFGRVEVVICGGGVTRQADLGQPHLSKTISPYPIRIANNYNKKIR
jgi:hypothetical protein